MTKPASPRRSPGSSMLFCEIFQPLLKNVPVYVLPEGEEADVDALVNHLAHWKINAGHARRLSHAGHARTAAGAWRTPRLLRHVMSSGERLPLEVVNAFALLLPHCVLHNYYGSTEVTADVVRCAVSPNASPDPLHMVPLGAPMPNCRIEVMSPARVPLPHGMLGEIAIAGPSVSRAISTAMGPAFLSGTACGSSLRRLGMWTESGELLGFAAATADQDTGAAGGAGRCRAGPAPTPRSGPGGGLRRGRWKDMRLAACCVVLRTPGRSRWTGCAGISGAA
jgi:hypothetical protein